MAPEPGMMASLGSDSWQRLRPPPLPNLPAMSRKAEHQYYYWLTRERFKGEGGVVELGCWLGAGTIHLAAGLRDRGSPAKVTCIDRFEWGGEMHKAKSPNGLARGDDFEPLFRSNTAFISEHIEPVRADLATIAWGGGPIEILVVDAPKSRDVVLAFLANFGPHLIGGTSLVAFQDYLHAPSFMLAAILSEFDELRVVDVVLDGATVGMQVTRPLALTEERIARADPLRWSEAETAERWGRVLDALPEAARDRLALSWAMLLSRQGRVEAARAETRRIADRPAVQRALHTWQNTYLAFRYRPIFEAAGIDVRPTTAAMHYMESSEALRAGNDDAARAGAEAALRIDPAYAPARARLASIARRQAAAEARRLAVETRARAVAEAAGARAERQRAREAERAHRAAERQRLRETERARLEAERQRLSEAERAQLEAERQRLREAERARKQAERQRRREADPARPKSSRPSSRRKLPKLIRKLVKWGRNLLGTRAG